MKKRCIICILLSLIMLVSAIFGMELTSFAQDETICIPQICGGTFYSCVVDADGSLWILGWDIYKQFFTDNYTNNDEDYADWIKVMEDVSQVSCGYEHTGILKKDGSLWMTGDNSYGQLGDDTTTYRQSPVKIMDDVAYVSCYDNQTGILKKDGSLWMTGYNNYGQLADGTNTTRKSPVKVMDNVAQVSCGKFTGILKKDGSLWMGGWNGKITPNHGASELDYKPVKIMDDVSQVSCGGEHTCILKKDGSLWMEGWKDDEPFGGDYNALEKVMDDAIQVSCGSSFAGILKEDNSLWMIGHNYYGEFGDGTTTATWSPIKVMDDVVQVNCGGPYGAHTSILKKDNSLLVVGELLYAYAKGKSKDTWSSISEYGINSGSEEDDILTSDYFILGKDDNNFDHNGLHFFNIEKVILAKSNKDAEYFLKKYKINYSISESEYKRLEHKKSSDYISLKIGSGRMLGPAFFEVDSLVKVSDEGGCTYRNEYSKELYKYLSLRKKLTIWGKLRCEWSGACFGISYAEILASEGRLKNILGNKSFYSQGKPRDNPVLKDVINYYHVLQHRPDYHSTVTAYRQNSKSKTSNNLKGFLTLFVNEAKSSEIAKKPFMFQLNPKDGEGHAVIVCGYSFDTKESKHRILIYNCNYPDEYQVFEVAEDYQSFYYIDEEGNNLFDSYESLAYTGIDFIDDYPTIASSSSKSGINKRSSALLKTTGEEPDNTTTISLSAFANCSIKNDKGETLIYDGQDYTGTMEVYDDRLVGDDDPTIYYDIDSSEHFTITNMQKGKPFCVSVSINDKCYYVDTLNASRIDINSEGVVLNGKDYDYYIAQGKESNNNAIGVEGSGKGEVSTNLDDSLNVNLENSSEYIEVSLMNDDYEKFELVEENVDALVVTASGSDLNIDKNIVPKDISDYAVDEITPQTYNGKPIAPTVKIGDGYKVLTQNKDYTLTYKNNVEPGTAHIEITGIGNYYGTITTTFSIVKVDENRIEKQDTASPTIAVGTIHDVEGNAVQILSENTAALTKAKNKKSVVVPATITIAGRTFKVVQVNAKAFTGKKIRTVTIGKNVKKIAKKAFSKSKATKIILKTKLLEKPTVKGSLKGAKIKTVQVKVGKKKENKTYLNKYKKIFTKKNAGKKVSVK